MLSEHIYSIKVDAILGRQNSYFYRQVLEDEDIGYSRPIKLLLLLHSLPQKPLRTTVCETLL